MTGLILLALAFLILLVVLAVVAARLLGARDAEGRRAAPGCLAGCAVAAALGFLGLVGLAVFTGAALVLSVPDEEFRADLREAADELGDGLRELRDELREHSDELRRELRDEIDDARRQRDRRASPTPAPQPEPASEVWRARVVLTWAGESDSLAALIEALTRTALAEPVDIEATETRDETDGARTIATLVANARCADVSALRTAIEEELARLNASSGVEYTLESVSDDRLR
jgi:hypothetical protein